MGSPAAGYGVSYGVPAAAPPPPAAVWNDQRARILELEECLRHRDIQVDRLHAELADAKLEIASALEASEQIGRQALEEQGGEMASLRQEVEQGRQSLEMERLHLDYALQKLGVRNPATLTPF